MLLDMYPDKISTSLCLQPPRISSLGRLAIFSLSILSFDILLPKPGNTL